MRDLTPIEIEKIARRALELDLFRFCLNCGGVFEVNDARREYCNRACKDQARDSKARVGFCVVCGSPKTLGSHKKTCELKTCADELIRRRNRKYRLQPHVRIAESKYGAARRAETGSTSTASRRSEAIRKREADAISIAKLLEKT